MPLTEYIPQWMKIPSFASLNHCICFASCEKEEKVEDGLVHDPESLIEKKETFLYSQNRVQSTEDAVFNSLFNNKN